MDGGDRSGRRPSLKERLGLKGLGCCGPTWGLGPTTISVRDDDDDDDDDDNDEEITVNGPPEAAQSPIQNGTSPPCLVHSPATGMNLAAALAAERQMRAALDLVAIMSPGRPRRVSLMRLLEETEAEVAEGERDQVCCVCMGRKKGAAFIPCGHTFCRVCSREVWVNRGSCPLCNRSILEILDIY